LNRVLVICGGLLLLLGLITALFEVGWLQDHGLGWPCAISGTALLLLSFVLERMKAAENHPLQSQAVVPQAKAQPQDEEWKPAPASSAPNQAGRKAVSFVAPVSRSDLGEAVRPDALSKTITPEILNLRFAAYRCEMSVETLRIIYQNASQKELKWYEISAIVIRQMPYQAPWEGKLILDIIPNVMAKEKVQPIRILSSTFVNYAFLPQGQSASTKENIRRFAAYILSQNRSVYLDPGTDYFVHAGQPPVRFFSMSQFSEYDSRYS
jgi:hypothetical protein